MMAPSHTNELKIPEKVLTLCCKVWPDRKTSCQKYDSAGHLGNPGYIIRVASRFRG